MAAKRAIITLYEDSDSFGRSDALAEVLAALTHVYSGHPDYDEVWR